MEASGPQSSAARETEGVKQRAKRRGDETKR